MKTKALKKLSVAIFLVLEQFLGLAKVNATTVKIEQAGITVKDVAGTSIASNLAAKAGYWVAGFTPTLDNLTSWDENFVAINGSWNASTKKFSVAFTMNDSQTVGGTQSAASATGTVIAGGTQLYLIGSNSAYNSSANTTSATFNSYITPASNSQVFILTDSTWIMRSGTGTTDPSTYTLPFTTTTQLAVFGGTTFGNLFNFDSTAGTGTLQLIPEPSSLSLVSFGIGLLIFQNRACLRRNKNV